jgi:hypothetical protein
LSEVIQISISGNQPSAIVLKYKIDRINYSKNLNNFPPDEFDASIESATWMNGLYNEKIQKNLWLSEVFKISNRSLWWHWITWANETNSIINAKIITLVSERLLTCCNLIKPSLIKYDGTNLWISGIISEVCKLKNISFEHTGRCKKSNLKYWQILFKLLRFFIRKILWDLNVIRFFQKPSQSKSAQEKRILLCSGDTWSIKNRHDKKFKYQDLHYGKIIDDLKENHSINFIQIIPKYRFLLKGIFKKIFIGNVTYEPFESYFKWRDLSFVFIQYVSLRKKWRAISQQSDWDSGLSPNKISFNWWVKNCIDYYLSLPVLEHLLCFHASRSILEKIRPDYVLLSGEWGPYSLSLIIEANHSSISVDALQHGFTSKAVFTNHLSSAVNLRIDDGPSPLANYFLLYGDFYKNLLNKYSKIPEQRCKVLGSPRFDNYTKSSLSRVNIRKNLMGNVNKFVILISVANVQNGYKYETLKQILSSLKEIKDLCIVVKLHPEESEKIDEYKMVAYSLGMSVIFKTGYGLWDLLVGSDLFITEFSTAVLESAIAEVETILIDFHSIGYAKHYDNHPFLVEINCGRDLASYIKSRIGYTKENIASVDFIKSHLYKTDGLSTKRLISFIEKRLS